MRRALILANGSFADARIAPLTSPAPDAHALTALLRRAEVGGYDVTMCTDQGALKQRIAIERFFASAMPGDTAVLFITGHGFKDGDGNLFFAANDTDKDYLSATAISAQFVSRQAARSMAAQNLLFIDTCYSGAFARGHVFKSGGDAITVDDFGADGARGTAVITASSSTQTASESEADGRMQSRFTRHLIEGIETGAADLRQSGRITLDDLFVYIRDALRRESPGQEPKRFNAIDGEMVIAQNPHIKTVQLPAGLRRKIASGKWETRAAACIELFAAASGNTGLRAIAVAALESFADDPDLRVQERASDELGRLRDAAPGKVVSGPSDIIAAPPVVPQPLPDNLPGELPPPVEPPLAPAPSRKSGIGWPVVVGMIAAPFLLIWAIEASKSDAPAEPTAYGDAAADAALPATDAMDGAADAAAAAAAITPAAGSMALEDAAPAIDANTMAYSADFPALRDACNQAGNAAAGDQCNALGLKYSNGSGVAKNIPRAIEVYEIGCAKGSMTACANAGAMYGDLSGSWKWPARSNRLLRQACDAKNSVGCSELGYNFEFGIGVPVDRVAARGFYVQGCNLGYKLGCDYLKKLGAPTVRLDISEEAKK